MELSSLTPAVIKLAVTAHQNITTEKLIKMLLLSEIKIDDKRVRSNAFLSSFIRTEEAVRKAESQEKFDFLLSLYVGSIKNDLVFEKPDLYSEAIHTLGDMSYREIVLLKTIDDFCRNNKEDYSSHGFNSFNKDMENKIQDVLGLDNKSQEAMTFRLLRTGFILTVSTIDGGVWPRISPLYKDVLDIIHYKWDSSMP